MNKKISYSSVIWIGCFISIIIGGLLHFTYKFSNMNMFVGIFSPINESVWEHLKLIFFPFTLFGIFFYFYSNRKFYNIFIFLVIGNIFAMLTTVILHYILNAISGQEMLIYNIILYILSMIIAFYCIYYYVYNKNLLPYSKKVSSQRIYGIILLVVFFTLFCANTFYPLKLPITLDPVTNTYGIFKTVK